MNMYKLTFWSEMALLLVVALILILPLKYGYGIISEPSKAVILYYTLSIIIIFTAQLLYMTPFKRFRIINLPAYAIGMSLLIVCFLFWIWQSSSRTIDFSGLENGDIWGAVVVSLARPAIHAFSHVFTSSVHRSKE